MPNILAVILGKINVLENAPIKSVTHNFFLISVTANLWSKANNIPKQDVQDFIDHWKSIRKQDEYTHRGNTKQPVVLSERTNALRQLKDDIQAGKMDYQTGEKMAHLEKLNENYDK